MSGKPAQQSVEPFGDAVQATGSPGAPLALETTAGSLLHRLAGYHLVHRVTRPPSIGKIYIAAVAISYIPLLITALSSPLPIATRTPTLRLPFLYDWNVAFLYLVSLPSLLALTITDQHALASSLQRVQMDGIVLIPNEAAVSLAKIWKRRFRAVNIGAYALGIGIGLLLAYFNYIAYTPAAVGFWIASQDQLLPVGIVFLGCIFLFYSLIPIYFLRSVAISFLLKDVVAHAQIRMLPFHPDKCGGLRPVGRLGLRNQYGLTVLGMNLVLLVIVSLRYLNVPSSLYGLIIAAVVAYVILGPIVFMGPLLPFRAGMLRTKAELMSEVAQRLRIELQRLRQQLADGPITREDEELIDRLRKVGAVIDEMPVWPFDAGTLRKFLTAYVTPLLGTVGYPLVKAIVTNVAQWLRT